MGYVIVQKSVVEEGWRNTNFAFGRLGKDSVALFAFFESCMHCICLTECVCCLCAGFVCWVKSCCCTLPAVVSHLCDCNDECLQHLPLHSITKQTQQQSKSERERSRKRDRRETALENNKNSMDPVNLQPLPRHIAANSAHRRSVHEHRPSVVVWIHVHL